MNNLRLLLQDEYGLLFLAMMAYVWVPTLMTRWYKYLSNFRIWKINFLFSIMLILLFLKMYKPDLSFLHKGSVLMLWSPFIFLLLFRGLDLLCIRLNHRPLVMTNRFTLKIGEVYNTYDIVSFLLVTMVPFFLPLAVREMGIL